MEYVYAAMILHTAGKSIDETSVEAIVKAAGLTPDKAKAKAIVEALKDVDIEAAIKEASAAQVVATAPIATGAAPAAAPAKKDDKKTEEEAAAGLGSLFG